MRFENNFVLVAPNIMIDPALKAIFTGDCLSARDERRQQNGLGATGIATMVSSGRRIASPLW
jgi:hypothetical protein